MKSLLLDIYKANNLHSGLGQFSLNFHNSLLENNTEWDLEFLAPANFQEFQNKNARYRSANFKSRYFPELGRKPNLWHSLQQFPSHHAPKGCPQILTIHDLNFLLEKNSKKADSYLKKLQRNVDRAQVITSISEYTSGLIKDRLNLAGKEIHTIHNGIYLKEFPNSKRPSIAPKTKFFFSIGIFSEKKNFHSLLPFMQELEDYQLIIAGDNNTSYGARLKSEIKSLGLENRIILAGRITDADKYWYYKNSEAFLFPSLAEGFGMPVIEAMLLGKAVFSSTKCSLPEIGGDASFYWDNFDHRSMIKTLKLGLAEMQKDPLAFEKRQKVHAAKFSWESCIQKYLKLYDETLK